VNAHAGAAAGAPPPDHGRGWDRMPERLRARGLRWTPQRRVLIEVLARVEGHVTGSGLVERCRAIDPSTTPSTVYRTLDVLEELGVIGHSHGLDGREEFHVGPAPGHGHLACRLCGETSELSDEEAAAFVASLRRDRQFEADLDHLTVVGRCRGCLGTSPDR
jgi:Fur family transcriptional regulator, ferric uptake regulator